MKLFDQVEADPAVGVLVLTGTGRTFGGPSPHLGCRAGGERERRAERRLRLRGRRQPAGGVGIPTICRLNGGVYGGATDLALACDFRIGVDTAEMFMPAARLGLHYYSSGIKRYVSRLGVDNAKKLFLTAQKISAPEMLRIGYLTAMVPAEALDEEVDRLANILAGNAPVAMAGMKRAINEFARGNSTGRRRPAPPRQHARRRDQGRHQGAGGETAAAILTSPIFPGSGLAKWRSTSFLLQPVRASPRTSSVT